jgi:hypothetical protein
VLVTRSEQGLQFAGAVSVTVQGRDRALSLGSGVKLPAALGKLQAVRLGGTMLKDADSNVVALYRDGSLEYLLPQGLPKGAPGDAAAIWRTTRLSFKKAASDRTPTEVSGAEFVAFLPGGTEELRQLCTDSRAMQVAGGRQGAFAAQMEWLAAAIRAFPSDPAIAPLEAYVEQAMRQRIEQFESGNAGLEVLDQALKLAELSQAVYPRQAGQERLRKALAARKSWLDRKRAILGAFAASEQWDAFLAGAHDFEIFEQAFPEVSRQRTEALKQSLQQHRKAGHQRQAEGEYGAAYRELRLASLRQPSDQALQEEVRVAWAEYSRRVAVDRQSRRENLSAGQRDAIERALYFAEQNRQSKNLDEALKNVQQAEALLGKALAGGSFAAESRTVLHKKAEILAAQGDLSRALATLDELDLLAVDEERQQANLLRNQLLFQLDKTLKDVKAQTRKAWAESRFHQVRALTRQGLRVKPDDPELLYTAGMAAFLLREPADSRTMLTRYLEVSNTLEGKAEQRAEVRRLLPALGGAPPAETGEPNWMSGKKLPPGVYYCPLSLAFQPRIESIDVGGKLKLSFEWEKGRLRSIVPVFDKGEKPTGEKKVSFAYNDRVPQVRSVALDAEAPAPSADPDEAVKSASLVLLNNPYLDPAAVRKLTGNNPALGIAGNRFFNPFVWDKVYYFRLTYDDLGRVRQAAELAGPGGAPANLVVEFDWNGLQLTAVRGYEGPDEKRRAKVYERTLHYEGGRLVSEDIQLQGRPARIRYTYKGDKLVSASCDKNAHLDARSRQVTFASN